MAETNPSTTSDVVIISGTRGLPKIINKILDHSGALTYTDGNITQADITKNSVLRKRIALTYSGDNVATVNVKIYATDGATVEQEKTITLSYTGDDITGFSSVEV